MRIELERVIDSSLTDLIQHGVAYALLAGLLLWSSRRKSPFTAVLCAGFAGVHGAAAEWFQYYVPHRNCDWPDALANLLGAACGAAIVCLLHHAANKQSPESMGASA